MEINNTDSIGRMIISPACGLKETPSHPPVTLALSPPLVIMLPCHQAANKSYPQLLRLLPLIPLLGWLCGSSCRWAYSISFLISLLPLPFYRLELKHQFVASVSGEGCHVCDSFVGCYVWRYLLGLSGKKICVPHKGLGFTWDHRAP